MFFRHTKIKQMYLPHTISQEPLGKQMNKRPEVPENKGCNNGETPGMMLKGALKTKGVPQDKLEQKADWEDFFSEINLVKICV